jgi:hypothetical protein
LTPIRRRDLLVLAAGLAIASWLLVRATYGDLPALDWWLPAPLAVLAVAEALGARTLRARLTVLREARNRRGTRGQPAQVRPVEPMLVARLAVLAQASAWVGAGFGGIWAGVLAHTAPRVGELQAAGPDALTAVLGIVASAGLVAAALLLEAACRVPPGTPEDEPPLDPAT